MAFLAKRFLSYSRSVRFYLTGTFITNIGDGMFALAISKLVFDKTGSVAGVGLVIIIQSVMTFLLNLLAGYVADTYNAKKILICTDLFQALLILLYTLSLVFFDTGSVLLFSLTTVISCISPFFRAANFKLLPEIDRQDLSLVKLNGLRSSVKQGGLLLGSALIAPFIVFHLIPLAFLLNSLSFLISCVCVSQIIHTAPPIETHAKKLSTIYKSWFLLLKELVNNHKVFFLVLFSTFDYLTINFINLIAIKYAQDILHNPAYISLIDIAYAAGAISSFLLIDAFFSKYEFKYVSWIGLFIQGTAIIFLNYFPTVVGAFILIFFVGIFTGTSISLFQTVLHKGVSQKFHGKISSFRDIMVSAQALCIIPLFSYLIGISFEKGMLSFGVLMIALAVLLAGLGLANYFPKIMLSDDKG